MVSSERKNFESSQTKPALHDHHDSQFLEQSETENYAARQDTSGQTRRPENGNVAGFFSDSHSEQAASTSLDSAAPLPEHRILGRYRARKWLGQGGFGRVYLAEDTRLGREVAVKVIPVRHENHQGDDQGDHHRHRSPPGRRDDSEARMLAQLDHQAIIPVYDGGLDETLGYCTVAKYVRGITLAARMQQTRFSAHDAAELVIRICDGLQHAHQKGIFHRDVKPSNILLDEFGHPHIADFGLAIHERDQADHRGEVSGSPSYMAPEQFRGNAHLMDGRADIWSVGVILYELLTGQKPFVGGTQAELVEAVLYKDPKPIRLIDPKIDAKLEQITLRCLRKESADRYSLARDLADELRAWQASSMTPPTPLEPSLRDSAEIGALVPPRRMPIIVPLMIAACLLGLLLIGQNMFPSGGIKQDDQGERSSLLDSPPTTTLEGRLQVPLWLADESVAQDSPVHLTDYLPLPSDVQVRLEAELPTAAYAYILWLDGDGNVFPLYPWREGKWEKHPDVESKVTKIELPNESDKGSESQAIRSSWKVSPTLGMETILLLVSSQPLLETFDFEDTLSRFRPPEAAKRNTWLEIHEDQLQVHEPRERGPILGPVDSLEQAHSRLVQKLKLTFPVIRGIAFSTERPEDGPAANAENATHSQ